MHTGSQPLRRGFAAAADLRRSGEALSGEWRFVRRHIATRMIQRRQLRQSLAPIPPLHVAPGE